MCYIRYHLYGFIGFIVLTLEKSNGEKLVDGKVIERSSLVEGAFYASVLSSMKVPPVMGSSVAKEKGKVIVGDKGCCLVGQAPLLGV